MTSQSAGAQWLRNPNSTFARPRNHLLSQQTPRSVPRQATIDLTNGSALDAFAEPAFKKQKLDIKRHITGDNVRKDDLEHLQRNIGAGSSEIKTSPDHSAKNTPLQSSDSTSELDQAETHIRREPILPVRPGGGAHRHHLSVEPTGKARVKEAVQVRPYVTEPPSSAPRYREDGPADFFPWNGDHPEDVLNELTTKQGYFDKLPGCQAESSTARPSIWSSLKHKSGLQILSSLFVSVFDQRQAHGTITANSTFKPPPRVTLTDTKREAWLRDLANASIPLRRLSRTIPHGIRGKVLLDHCLAKQIPTSRAIWLAKCVGANEIRAFKRKGASGAFALGGETKWIKDWTTNVEQFVEMIITLCGTSEWRSKINYGLRLTTQLFSERLLDQEHYIDWLIASLHSSDLDTTPIWLLVAQIYWKEILEHRQRGRKLAEAILGQLYTINQQADKETFVSLEQQLTKTLNSLALSAPACLLLPNCWIKYETMLRDCFQKQNDIPASYFEHVSRRNSRLIQTLEGQSWQVTPSPRQELITLLDSNTEWPKMVKFTDDCLAATDNSAVFVITCLEWATSLYRRGHARLYFAARMLRRWSKHGFDVEKPILDFLAANPDLPGLHSGNTYRLIAELVRSKHFLVGRYLEWLLSRGTLYNCRRPNRDDPCDVRLLFELPLYGLPTHILNLRRILVSSVGASIAEENVTINSVKSWISRRVPGICVVPDALTDHELKHWDIAQLSQTIKSDIGRWIRQGVAFRFQGCNANSPGAIEDGTRQAKPSSTITLKQYHGVRHVLEEIEDFTILADVLKIVSNSTDDSILTAITDTINHHFDTMVAIGAVDDLFQSLWQQYRNIHKRQRVEQSFLDSLTDLGERLPKAAREARHLRKELLLHQQTISLTVCSPISDHMAETLQSAEATFADEIDQLLASGTSMDKQVLSQVFKTIIGRLELSWHESMPPSINFADLLVQVRSFGAETFDMLIADWLQSILCSTSRPSLAAILSPLICTEIVTLDLVLARTAALLQDTAPLAKFIEVALDALDLLTVTELESLPPMVYRQYRFHFQQQRAMKASISSVIVLVRTAIDACSREEIPCARARDRITSPGIRTLIQTLITQHGQKYSEISSAFDLGLSVDEVQSLIDDMVYPSHSQATSHLSFRDQILKLLEVVGDLNSPICQLKLRTAFGAAVRSSDNAASTLMAILLQTVESSDDTCLPYWPILASGLAADQALQVREEAERKLVLDTNKEADADLTHRQRLTDVLTSVVAATAFSIKNDVTSPLVTQIADRLTALLTSLPLSIDQPSTEGLPAHKSGQALEHSYLSIDILLRLLLIHQATLQHPKFSQSTLTRLLVTLSLLLINPILSTHPTLSSHIYDTLASLTDLQTEETRLRCIRILRDQQRTKEPCLVFLFGYSESIENEWLQLVTNPASTASEVKPLGSATGSVVTAKTTTMQPFPLRRWELMQDATPLVTENDTSLSLTLFGARKAVL